MKTDNCLLFLWILVASASSASVRNLNNKPPDILDSGNQETLRDHSSYHMAQLISKKPAQVITGNGMRSPTVESREQQEVVRENSPGLIQTMMVNTSNWLEEINLANKSTRPHKCRIMFIKLKPKPHVDVLDYNCTQSSLDDNSMKMSDIYRFNHTDYDRFREVGKETEIRETPNINNHTGQQYNDSAIRSGSRTKRDMYYQKSSFNENRRNYQTDNDDVNVPLENIYSTKNVTVGMNFEGFVDRDDLDDVHHQSTPDCNINYSVVSLSDGLMDKRIGSQPQTSEYSEECDCQKSDAQVGPNSNPLTECDCRKKVQIVNTNSSPILTITERPLINVQDHKSVRPVDMEVIDIIDEHYGLPADTVRELLDVYHKSDGKYMPKVIFLAPPSKQNQPDTASSQPPIIANQWQYFRSFSKDPRDKTPADFPNFFKWLERYGYNTSCKTPDHDSSSKTGQMVLPVDMAVHDIITQNPYGLPSAIIEELVDLYNQTGGKYRPKVIVHPLRRPKSNEPNPDPLPSVEPLQWQYFRSVSHNQKDKTPEDFASFLSWKKDMCLMIVAHTHEETRFGNSVSFIQDDRIQSSEDIRGHRGKETPDTYDQTEH